MSITVNFRSSQGEITSRRFRAGEGVSVYGKSTGVVLPDVVGTRIRLVLDEAGYYQDTRVSDIFGGWSGWITFPSTPGSGTLRVTAYRPLGTETVEVPIAWGEARDVKLPPVPREEPTSGLGETIFETLSSLKVVALAAIVVAGVYFLSPLTRKK